MTSYNHILQPIAFRLTTIRNRNVMGSMHSGLEDRFYNYPKLAAYFAERAKGGVGLIITWRYFSQPSGLVAALPGEP